jgi:twitching motility protein PilT
LLKNYILGIEKLAKFDKEKELDCSYGLEGIARFRMNIFIDRGKISCVMRALNTEIPSFSKIGLPDSVQQLLSRPRGLMLVTGPTGSGKTTTLASGIDWINTNYAHQTQEIFPLSIKIFILNLAIPSNP